MLTMARVSCVLTLGIGTAPLAAQNLLVNPDFDIDLAGWTAATVPLPGVPSHDPAEGSPQAGSLRVSSGGRRSSVRPEPQLPVPNVRVQQCVAVTAGAPYDVGVRCHVAAAQPPDEGYCLAALIWHADDNCTTALPGVFQSALVRDATSYRSTELQGLEAPSAARRALVALDSGTTSAHFDAAYLRRSSFKGDLDGDGQQDLVLAHGSGELERWRMNGTTRASATAITPAAPGAPWQVVASDDFNGDRHADLVFWNAASGAVEFWLMNDAGRLGAPVALGGAPARPVDWRPAASGDFNGDGAPDLLWRHQATQELQVWMLAGTTKIGESNPSPDQAAHANWRVVAAVDVDHAGGVDLVWHNADSGRVVVWLMDAALARISGRFTSPAAAGDANWVVVAAGDYGPGPAGFGGTPDLIWRNETSGRLVAWHMDGATRTAGLFLAPNQPDANPLDWSIVAPR